MEESRRRCTVGRGFRQEETTMIEEEIERRKRFLRNQARYLIRAENDLKIKTALITIRNIYVGRIGKEFDPVLSQKLDCLTWFLEN